MKVETLKEIFPVVFLTVVVFLSVFLITETDNLTQGEIAYQEEQQTKSMLREMFPDMSEYAIEDDIYIVYCDGVGIGYAFLAVGKGYAGDIDILVGLENETTVKGITIVSQSETPGLGSRITEPSFADEFIGLNIGDVALRQDGGQIDAITGATISSTAVVDAVRTTAMEKVKSLMDKGEESQ